jgi:hypothetical protein
VNFNFCTFFASLEQKGLPTEWKEALKNSSITLKEQLQNPQAVIAALDFYYHHNTPSKYMYPSDKSKLLFSQKVYFTRKLRVFCGGASIRLNCPSKVILGITEFFSDLVFW